METDAVVNATDEIFSASGGVDLAINQAGGKEIHEECVSYGRISKGSSIITASGKLSSAFVIHTVGPVWKGGHDSENIFLSSAYLSSLKLAKRNGCRSISFPLISTGTFKYPKKEAFLVATNTICSYLSDNNMEVYLVIFDDENLECARKIFPEIEEGPMTKRPDSIESFSEALFRMIREKGADEVALYKKAGIDRRLFSKIRSDRLYNPSKETAIKLSIALNLSESEVAYLLSKAGYAFSQSSLFDLTIRNFIKKRNYSFFDINEALLTKCGKIL